MAVQFFVVLVGCADCVRLLYSAKSEFAAQ